MTNMQNHADNLSARLQAGVNTSIITDRGTGQMADIELGATQAGFTTFTISSNNLAEMKFFFMGTDGKVHFLCPDEVLTADVFVLDNILDESEGVKLLESLMAGTIFGMALPKTPLLIVCDSFTPEGFELLS